MARSRTNFSTVRSDARTEPYKKSDEFTSFQLNQAAVERHWESFPWQAKKFLLDTLDKINLSTLLRFWSEPQLAEFTRGKVAGSICGASWYLALVYLNLGKIEESRALTLNGSFLQQCYNTSIDYIKGVCESRASHINEDKLPFFCSGYFSVSSSQSLENFLQEKLPAEYQRMMTSFVGFSRREPTMEYINQISQDWNSSLKSQQKRRPKCEGEEKKIKITFVDQIGCGEEFSIGVSTSLKTLFNEYADEKGISLRNIRFSYNGKTIFLSSAGRQTPEELGMSDHDTITVLSTVVDQVVEVSKEEISYKNPSRKGSSPTKKNKSKRKKKGHNAFKISKSDHDYKVEHSQALTRLFEEAEPKFKQIRQDLNVLVLECKKPKKRINASNANESVSSFVSNPITEDSCGKAGKSHFVVQVGEVENLYKTTKPSTVVQSNISQLTCIASLDLHGLTKYEAVKILERSLEKWKDEAMSGSYPWVIPAVIVCGCGSQVLSETVEQWIKQKSCVANAPKSLVSKFLPRAA